MADLVIAEYEDIANVADAIRSKTGITDTMTLSEMASNVMSISGTDITIDSELSETSTNPVQNKAVTKEIRQLSEEIANVEDMTAQIIINASEINVPILWEQGGLNSENNAVPVDVDIYVRTVSYLPKLKGVPLVITPTNDKTIYYVYTWVDGVYSNAKGYNKQIELFIAENEECKIVVANADSVPFSPQEVDSYIKITRIAQYVTRKEFQNLKAEVTTLYPKLTNSGVVEKNGNIKDMAESMYTDLIDIRGYDTMDFATYLNSSSASVSFYSINGTFLADLVITSDTSIATLVDGQIDLTEEKYNNVAYVRLCCYDNKMKFDKFYCKIYRKNSIYELQNTIFAGKKVNLMGDSITSTDYTRPTWWEIIAKNTGISFNNYGQSGTTLAHTDSRHDWDFSFEKDELPEYDSEDSSTWESGNCFFERVDEMDTSADAVIVMGGTNDVGVPRGSWDSTDTSTFFGALNVLIQRLLTTFIGKPIIFCTMIQSKDAYSSNVADALSTLMDKADNNTLTLQLREEAIKAKCRQYGIPCVDLFNESGVNGVDGGVYFRTNDTLHPSEVGQKRIACMVQDTLEKYLKY